ncbi:GNAT family N-acetyltransferase [Rathayibacter festucae]|uniref:GNAT family N-acetyltransferase n=1 Tax=Rathayibacter festucae TaxID=110937 RepID=UPI0031344220
MSHRGRRPAGAGAGSARLAAHRRPSTARPAPRRPRRRDAAADRRAGADARPDDFAELLALEVAPESRRSGVARRLVAAALSYASVQRIRTLRFRVPVEAEAALAAARALGFTEIDGFGAHVGDDSGVCFARSVR